MFMYGYTSFRPVIIAFCLFLGGCSTQQRLGKAAQKTLFNDAVLKHAHVGIDIYDPASGQSLYRYNAEKYFIPASNTKILSCYAGMKYLGDSLHGIRYAITDEAVWIRPTGDPTLLHEDYADQPVMEFLKRQTKPVLLEADNWKTNALGSGWSWEDYSYDYMVERSPLPVYGNVIRWYQDIQKDTVNGRPSFSVSSSPEINWKVRFDAADQNSQFSVERSRDENVFLIHQGPEPHARREVPFVTHGLTSSIELLRDVTGKQIQQAAPGASVKSSYAILKSRPTDSLLRPMMYRSDNFFAEQILLMVSDRLLGYMNEEMVIDTLLKTDLKELPQAPRWVDGSGLSRYNLFSPMDFVFLLNKMQHEFGMERVKTVFPAGGKGTLSSYYQNLSSSLYAKTGSLGGVICLSGYLLTRKQRWLLFSVLVNNHQGSGAHIRKQVESFLQQVYQSY
jgi:D-alanyl-D-alanine carboxypeptidase/D-alanyl-D-alanine-endopeptidase (penicillin-binding protein 4)